MACDLLIKNGLLIDGTGAPARRADVAIAGGCIAEVGSVTGGAKRVIDASGLAVAPGFIDPHAHYDAQICWDRALTPTSWHLPGRAKRMVMRSQGIEYTIVNGAVTWEKGELTGTAAGTVLRS